MYSPGARAARSRPPRPAGSAGTGGSRASAGLASFRTDQSCSSPPRSTAVATCTVEALRPRTASATTRAPQPECPARTPRAAAPRCRREARVRRGAPGRGTCGRAARRRRVERDEERDGLAERFEAAEAERRTRRRQGGSLEPPPHGGDESERPSEPIKRSSSSPRLGIAVQRVAAGILAGLGEALGDEPLLFWRQDEPLPAPFSPGDPPGFPICAHDLHGFHPLPHAAAAHRARPCGVGRRQAARGRERARRRIGGEPQAERRAASPICAAVTTRRPTPPRCAHSGAIQWNPGLRSTSTRARPLRPACRSPTRAAPGVCPCPPPSAPAAAALPRRAAGRPRRDDPMDPCPLGVRGADALVSGEAGERVGGSAT